MMYLPVLCMEFDGKPANFIRKDHDYLLIFEPVGDKIVDGICALPRVDRVVIWYGSLSDQQRKRILDLQHNQDEYTVLKRDEESARTAYDSAMQRGGETELESRLKNTNTAILNFAFPPMKPSSPLLLLNMALGFILGCMIATGASLIRERFDQRIHTHMDILEGTGIAVLAELPSVHISKRRYRRRRSWFQSKEKTMQRLESRNAENVL
jgi:hypothetical protein